MARYEEDLPSQFGFRNWLSGENASCLGSETKLGGPKHVQQTWTPGISSRRRALREMLLTQGVIGREGSLMDSVVATKDGKSKTEKDASPWSWVAAQGD
jgi:hypothetical protein